MTEALDDRRSTGLKRFYSKASALVVQSAEITVEQLAFNSNENQQHKIHWGFGWRCQHANAWRRKPLCRHGGGVATGHTPTPPHSRTTFRAGGGGGGWVWGGGKGGCQEGEGGGFIP